MIPTLLRALRLGRPAPKSDALLEVMLLQNRLNRAQLELMEWLEDRVAALEEEAKPPSSQDTAPSGDGQSGRARS